MKRCFAVAVSVFVISAFSRTFWENNKKPVYHISPPVLEYPPASFRQLPVDRKIISLTDIFDGHFSETSDSLELVFTGDTGLVRSINTKTVSTDDFRWPFIHAADILRRADLTVVNLEGPLVPDCPSTIEGMVFCGDPRNIQGLLFAGVDVANIANNHIGDYGEAGYKSTVDVLQTHGILAYGNALSGHAQIQTLRVSDTIIGFVGYIQVYPDRPYIAKGTAETIRHAVNKARNMTDLVIVTFHWGIEYTDRPTDEQKTLARSAVDSGAGLVIGHHPHWIQSVEIYQNVPILYSLGNFVFDQMWSKKTREGLIARVSVEKNAVLDIKLVPVIIEDYGQPRIADAEESRRILEELRITSKKE